MNNQETKNKSFKEILDKILLPFREEYRRKCSNESVMGGFNRYVINWIDKALLKCPADINIKNHLEEIREDFYNYPRVLPRKRGEILKKVHPIIGAISEGKPLPPIKTIKNNPVKEKKKKLPGEKKKTVNVHLDDSVSGMTGIGAKVTSYLKKLNIDTIEDLLFHIPREYQDRRHIANLNEIEMGRFQVIKGTLGDIKQRKVRRNMHITKASLFDEYGSLSLVWFNKPYLRNSLKTGEKYIVTGNVEIKFNEAQINSPEIEEWEKGMNAQGGITPLYPLTEGISQSFMRKIVASCVRKYSGLIVDVFPDDFRKRLGLMSAQEAIQKIHYPSDMEDVDCAKLRILFEEAFFLQLMIARRKRAFRKSSKNRKYDYDPYFLKQFEDTLHFQLTNSQKNAMKEILEDMLSPTSMNRLIQGDVGSGKTILCIFFTLLCARSGYQSAIMAPTEVLAEQHFYRFREFLGKFDIKTELLIGAVNPGEKIRIKSLLESGELKVVVGTQALIQEDVRFRNLAFAVVDEQHKFGVMQRATLKEKGSNADFLFTTATPIPRSLCLTLYGDLDVTTIDEIPPGRQPVKTLWVTQEEKKRIYDFVKREVDDGGQAYIICPLIEESEKMDLTALMQEYEEVKKRFPDLPIGLLHGRMTGYEKEMTMQEFSSGKFRILVSTTVVEVGVDIPGASVMVVLDAQRYGLGQLHQLRGRVGRGSRKSTCILVESGSTEEAGKRLRILTRTNSGFEIAEEDLKIRGPGDVMGVRQSGLPSLKFLDMVKDYKILHKAREEAFFIEKEDPELSDKKFKLIKEKIDRKYKNSWDIFH
ncbi:MAG: ATP-dependent DNA helicase RecG [Candidatus Eremiobacteraeota bacterium]|nr:ATP-dependent DNA helicase RecG [Candidatus Eremiobacteraeota bacterium]